MDSLIALEITTPEDESVLFAPEIFPRTSSPRRTSSSLTVPVVSSQARLLPLPLTNPNYLSVEYPYHGGHYKSPSVRRLSPPSPSPSLNIPLPHRENGPKTRRISATSCDTTFSCQSSSLSYSSLSYQHAVLNGSASNSRNSINSSSSDLPDDKPEPLLDPLSRRLSWEITTSDYYSGHFRDCDTYSNILTPIPRNGQTRMDGKSVSVRNSKVFVWPGGTTANFVRPCVSKICL